jgi:hypothetical protein
MSPAFGPPAVRASHPYNAGPSQQAAIRTAISTARNALAGIRGKP